MASTFTARTACFPAPFTGPPKRAVPAALAFATCCFFRCQVDELTLTSHAAGLGGEAGSDSSAELHTFLSRGSSTSAAKLAARIASLPDEAELHRVLVFRSADGERREPLSFPRAQSIRTHARSRDPFWLYLVSMLSYWSSSGILPQDSGLVGRRSPDTRPPVPSFVCCVGVPVPARVSVIPRAVFLSFYVRPPLSPLSNASLLLRTSLLLSCTMHTHTHTRRSRGLAAKPRPPNTAPTRHEG